MEQLHAESSCLLGEKLSHIEHVNEKTDTALWALYGGQGNPMPSMARSFSASGKARQLAWKITMLTRGGIVRMPTIHGVMTRGEHPDPDVLLLERMRGASVEIPARTPERWEQLKDQIVEALLVWHRQDSRGRIDAVDNTQENFWPSWYWQHVEMLWTTLNQSNNTGLTMQDKRILFCAREYLPALFEGFSDNCVLTHGSFCSRSMSKDSRNDQLLAMVRLGLVLWTPREYELFRLIDNSLAGDLLWSYLQRALMARSFIRWRWLYVLWDGAAQLANTGRSSWRNFDLVSKSLLPWLA